MIIKQNKVGEGFDITYKAWHNQYLLTGKYRNFSVVDDGDIVEVYEILPATGEMAFKTLADRSIAEAFKLNDPRRFHIQELQYQFYDDNLVPNENYFLRFPKAAEMKKAVMDSTNYRPRKKNRDIDKTGDKTLLGLLVSTIPKQIWTMIRGVLILLTAYILWELFGETLVSFFGN